MLPRKNNKKFIDITVTKDQVVKFKKSWPCSGLPDEPITFTFETATGDLVDINPSDIDGDAVVALSQDAQIAAGFQLFS